MSKLNVKNLRVGDTVKVEGVVNEIGTFGAYFSSGDGNYFGEYSDLSLVKRRKIKVGDRVSGREVQEHQWKRGTLLKWVGWPICELEPVFFMLNADATWSDTSDPSSLLQFEHFADDADDDEAIYEVVYLP